MKFLLGCLMMLAGAALGVYVGVWWAFVGGIVDIYNGVVAVPPEITAAAFGVVKVVLAPLIGWLTAIVAIFPGFAVATSD